MINHADHYVSVIKDELAKAARANGIDTSLIGYALSSTFGPVEVAPGQQALMPGWLLVVSLRVELVGVAPVSVPMVVPYQIDTAKQIVHMPGEDDFRGAARQAFGVALQARDQLLHPNQAPGAVLGEIIR